MTPNRIPGALYDTLDPDDTRRVDTRAAFISGYQAGHRAGVESADLGHGIGIDDKCPRCEAAALDGLATNGPAQAYTMGYEAGRVEAFAQQAATAVESATTELELLAAGGYTPAQEARADALVAVSRIFTGTTGPGDGEDDLIEATQIVVEMARSFAHYIEHGDPPCTPPPCPPLETSLIESIYDQHVDAALDIVRGNPDLGDRVDQALDAAKLAQPRTRPPHLQPITGNRGFKSLPPIPGTHGGQPAGAVSVRESSAANAPHLWIEASHPSDRNDPNSTPVEGCVHIRAEDAWRFADQIRYLVEHHYQGSATPAAEPPPT